MVLSVVVNIDVRRKVSGLVWKQSSYSLVRGASLINLEKRSSVCHFPSIELLLEKVSLRLLSKSVEVLIVLYFSSIDGLLF